MTLGFIKYFEPRFMPLLKLGHSHLCHMFNNMILTCGGKGKWAYTTGNNSRAVAYCVKSMFDCVECCLSLDSFFLDKGESTISLKNMCSNKIIPGFNRFLIRIVHNLF